MATKQIYASRGGTNYKPYAIDETAPLQQYKIPGHNMDTWSINDANNQQWYLTDGGNWRNTATKALSPTAPTWQAAAAPAPAAPAEPGPVNNVQPQETFRSIYDFAPEGMDSLLRPRDPGELSFGNVQDYIPQNWQPSAAYNFQVEQGNKDISKQLAAKGLLGSGAEDEMRGQMTSRAAADEANRLMDMANTSYAANNAAKTEAYRQRVDETNNLRNLLSNYMGVDYNMYNNIQEANKDRELQRDSQGLTMTQMILDAWKSLNPMQYGYPATTSATDLYQNLGKTLSSLNMAGGGGGGGGSAVPPIPPYFAPGATSQSGTRDLVQIGGSVLPSLVKALKNF